MDTLVLGVLVCHGACVESSVGSWVAPSDALGMLAGSWACELPSRTRPLRSPLIWECTRFCLSPDGVREGTISTSLMLAAAELGQRFHLAHAAAVFDRPMIRIYRTLGWAPEVLGDAEYGEARICVGLWDFASAPLAQLRDRAGVSEKTTDRWFREAFRTGRTSA